MPEIDSSTEIQELSARWDRSNMARVIDGIGGQVEFALGDPDFPGLTKSGFDEVLVVGMGGSALPVDILNDVLEDYLPRPVGVCRQYELPAVRSGNRLLVFSSFSGNTEEVVEPLRSLPPEAPGVVIVTAGGELAEIGRERNIPTVRIPAEREPEGFQPRCASGYIVTYLARLLASSGYGQIPLESFRRLVPFLSQLDGRAEGKRIARALDGRIPIFYTDEPHALSVGRIAKIKFNENAKRPAFFNALPEANHNEMIGFSGAESDFTLLYFRDPESHAKVHRRFEIMRQVLAGSNVATLEWEMPGSNQLERVFAALFVADWLSYFSALFGGIDPTPVALVEEFKQMLSEPEPGAPR